MANRCSPAQKATDAGGRLPRTHSTNPVLRRVRWLMTGSLVFCFYGSFYCTAVFDDMSVRAHSTPCEEGWPRHQKMVPSEKGADGVVAHKSGSEMRFENRLVSDHPVCAEI